MSNTESFYLDITSQDETQKRVTILPEKLSDDNKMVLKQYFGARLNEVESKEANEILVRSSPKDVQHLKQKMVNGSAPQDDANTQVVKYCQYPAEGTGTVSVTTEDYLCLEDEQFLNDVIIDFYLRYLQFGIISEHDRDRMHIFSTYFYKRLTTRPKQVKNKLHPIEDNSNLTPAEKRYERVKKGQKKVDLFEKDFIVVPINEHAHWFVCVICFPGQVGCTRFDDGSPCSPPPTRANQRKKKVKRKEKKPLQIGSTTIIPLKSGDREVQRFQLGEEEFSDRDEADASDDDMEDEADDDSKESGANSSKSSNENSRNGDEEESKRTAAGDDGDEDSDKKEGAKDAASDGSSRVAIKQPCILVFDSLAGGSKAKVAQTLRDYLTCEYKAKTSSSDRVYTTKTMPANAPKVQQQPNFSDCGIYVIQYVEMFFRIPIKDYALPVTSLKNWFEDSEVTNKRYTIAQLIEKLNEEQNPGKKAVFPPINFVPEAVDDEDDDDDGDDDKVNIVQVTSSSTTQMVRLTSGGPAKASPRLVTTLQGANKVSVHPLASQGKMLISKKGEQIRVTPLGGQGLPPGVTVTPSRSTSLQLTPTVSAAGEGPAVHLGPSIQVRKLSSHPATFGGSQSSLAASSSGSQSSLEPYLQTSPDSTSNGNDNNKQEDNEPQILEQSNSDNETNEIFVPDSQGLESGEDSNSSIKRPGDAVDPIGGKRMKQDSS